MAFTSTLTPWIARVFPFVQWLRNYRFRMLQYDLLAGVTVSLVLIPQSMAYAQLAGLPSYYGLYAAFLPPLIAALFGSSPQLATGPVAVVSLMTAVALEPLAIQGSAGYITYAITLAFMVGTFQFMLGLLRLGLVVNFISHPVVNGFTNAAAIIIATSQLPNLLGVQVEKGAHHYETMIRLVASASYHIYWPTLIMGLGAFFFMFGLKRIAPRTPYILVAVALTSLASWAIGYEQNAIMKLHEIPSAKAREQILEFNAALEGLSSLTATRAEAGRKLADRKRGDDVIALLDAKRDADVIGIRVEQQKYRIEQLREQLRRFLFRGVLWDDGSVELLLPDDHPRQTDRRYRTWKLRVGTRPLDVDGLNLKSGGDVVGKIPRGLPPLGVPEIDVKIVGRLLPLAVIIALLGFMEAISIAKAMAAKTGSRIDPNQELVGQGLANMCGAFAGSYPTSGSFSRSAVNLQAGAVSGLSGVATSLAVMIVLLFFTPLLYHLPQSVLAAVIMLAVVGLVNVSGFVHAWRVQWYDGAISIVAFVTTLAFAPHLEKGIMVGVGLSLLVYLHKSMWPKVPSLSRYSDEVMRDSAAFGLQECEYIAVVRFDGPLIFANSSYLEDQIIKRRAALKNLKHIHIVADGINDIDASGQEVLSLMVDRIRSAGMDISLSDIKWPVMVVLQRTHFIEKIGEDHIYPTLEKAIAAIHERTHRGGQEEKCPLVTVCLLSDAVPSKEGIQCQ